MKFLKKGMQIINQKNIPRTNDYEIKTYTNNMKNRSPMAQNSYYSRRSPIKKDQRSSDSGAGEMMYVEPNDVNFRQNDEISQTSKFYLMRSPGGQREENVGTYRNENERSRIEASQTIGYPKIGQIPQFNIELDKRRERMSRSPKTINIGETAKEVEYNMKTLRGRSPQVSRMNSPQDIPVIERSYNLMSEAGNIFLDPPMQQGSFIRQNEILGSPGYVQNSYEMKMSQEMGENSREIKFNMNPRDLRDNVQKTIQKMSPRGNVDGESDSGSEKDNVNQVKDIKTQLDNRRSNIVLKNDDGMREGRTIRGEIEKIQDYVRTKEQENITGEEVKKLVRQYVKAYDPRRDQDGNLISDTQTVLQSKNDEMFNDRYKVLQKMNKLSNILLSKNRTGSPESATLNRSFGEDGKNQLDIGTLNKTGIVDVKKTYRKPRRNKFLYVSLAMLSAKGPNTEDRTILRRMRLDKGGVVDLAQETLQKKSKFKIKKARAGGRGITTINPKYREKAAKIVQAWWRERKEKYKRILEQIIKIQSVWRGKFTRKYIYDVIYISYLQEKFLSIMRKVLVNHIRPYVFDKLFSKKKIN